MVTPVEELPNELGEAWNELSSGRDARRLRKHLPVLRRSILQTAKLEGSLRERFGARQAELVDPETRTEARAKLVSSVQLHALSIDSILKVFSALSADSQAAVQKILEWVLNHVVSVLTAFADQLALESWSVAVTGSFPPAISFTITLTFH